METNTANLMSYALGGAGFAIFIAIIIIAISSKIIRGRKAKDNPKNKKKEKQIKKQKQKQTKVKKQEQENQSQSQNQSQNQNQIKQQPVTQPKEAKRQPVPVEQPKNKIIPIQIDFYKFPVSMGSENRTFFIEGCLNIGRNEDGNNWIVQDDPTISGKHCRLYQEDNSLYIEDLRSTNGTYVNDQRIVEATKLQNHDKVRLGQSEYHIRR